MNKIATLLLGAAALGTAVVPGEVQAQFGASLAVGEGQILAAEPGRILGPGAVLVFEKRGGSWTQVAELTASDGEPGDEFGSAMAVDGGMLLVAGAKGVYAFRRDGGAWRETGRLTAPDVTDEDAFGAALALSGDRALVGAPQQADATGAVYLFRRTGADWTQEGEKLSGPGAGAAFGASVAFDGRHALVGAPAANNRVGAAYAYRVGAAGLEVPARSRSRASPGAASSARASGWKGSGPWCRRPSSARPPVRSSCSPWARTGGSSTPG
ncbi:MAG: FG-GAP repeat protein [Longimicrobiales bacterium]|nr:FG-GAP repeat protein [Longimicrobiales bacterium]